MTTVGDMLFHLGGVPVGAIAEVMLAGGKWYFCDPTNGSTNGDALTPGTAIKSLESAYALTRDGYNDGVILIGGATAENPAATITWSNTYCHLIGANAGLPGMGQRSRIVGTAAHDLSPVIEFSGKGCLVANIQVYNGADLVSAVGNVLVSGDDNRFVNCFFAGGGHATPAGAAGMYSLSVSGAENTFERCTIGLDTIVRTSTNAELIVSGPRNRFVKCEIRKQSVTTGNFLVKIDATLDLRDVQFEDVLFFNYSANWAAGPTDAFNMSGAQTHWVILRGQCQFVGCTGLANTVTHLYGAGAAPNAGMYLSTQPTT
jgi:hypothetical protein